MEDIIGLLLFLIFGLISVIGGKAGKKSADGSGKGKPTLREIIAELTKEFRQDDESSEASAAMERLSEEEIHGESAKPRNKKKSAPVPAAPKKEPAVPETEDVFPIRLRQAVIWKEILDAPVSLR